MVVIDKMEVSISVVMEEEMAIEEITREVIEMADLVEVNTEEEENIEEEVNTEEEEIEIEGMVEVIVVEDVGMIKMVEDMIVVDSNNHLIIGVPQVIMHGVEDRQLNLLVMHGVEDKLNQLVMHGELKRKQRLHQQMHGEVEKQKLNNQVLGVVVQVRLKLMMRHQEEEHGGRASQ